MAFISSVSVPFATHSSLQIRPLHSQLPTSSALPSKHRHLSMTSSSVSTPSSTQYPPRKFRGMMQHKSESFWFYKFLSLVYDKFVNPFHWTPEMRSTALKSLELTDPSLGICDIGGGTGFTTEGIIAEYKHHPNRITLLDQSTDQLKVAKSKSVLNGVRILQGDAESLPFATNAYDRYVSAGSIEYWPNPEMGIQEAYRVIRPGGIAVIIGPIRATNPISRFFCDLWMLFPMKTEYIQWFQSAGFEDIEIQDIGPKLYKGVRQHGLIMGVVVKGRKPKSEQNASGNVKKSGSTSQLDRVVREDRKMSMGIARRVLFLARLLVGIIAGFYYFLIPFVIMAYAAVFIRTHNKQ